MAVTDDAIEAIRQMILSGQLGPGDRLPREADLADRLGLSRSSLREAVKALALINVLTVRQGDGTYVTSLDPAVLTDAFSFIFDFHQEAAVAQILQVRRILEPAATAIAAVQMPQDQIDGLADLLATLDDASSIDDWIRVDTEFHIRIAAGTGNPLLCSLLEAMFGRTRLARTWRGHLQKDALQRTQAEHVAIQRALAARDPELARSWATAHIAGVEEWVRQSRELR
jgi:GntR family transcriptional regulator, transcriptional repressor for pyruvate dehydrogenase complex